MTDLAVATAVVGVVEIIDAIVKHESKLRKLIKKLKACCCSGRPSPPGTPPATSEDTAFETTTEGELPIDI
jgi:hypothetical protein